MQPESKARQPLPNDEPLLRAALPPVSQVEFAAARQGSAGARMSYRAAGPRDGHAVVMLHGLGSSSAGYRGQLAGLPPDVRAIAWDAPGFGASDPLPMPSPTADDFAHALDAFIQALQLSTPVTLVGSSWGSVIAATYASLFPGKVRALVLLAPNVARGALPEDQRAALLEGLHAGAEKTLAEDRAEVAHRLLPPDAPQLVREHVLRLRDAMTLKGWMQAVGMLFSVHTPDRLAAVRCPVSIVVGLEDRLAPPALHAVPLRDSAPHASLYEIPHCGHMPKLEYPSQVNGVILSAVRASA